MTRQFYLDTSIWLDYYEKRGENGQIAFRFLSKVLPEQLDAARKFMHQRSVPKGDALHALLARDNDALLISRDKDFRKLQDITRVYLPEEFI